MYLVGFKLNCIRYRNVRKKIKLVDIGFNKTIPSLPPAPFLTEDPPPPPCLLIHEKSVKTTSRLKSLHKIKESFSVFLSFFLSFFFSSNYRQSFCWRMHTRSANALIGIKIFFFQFLKTFFCTTGEISLRWKQNLFSSTWGELNNFILFEKKLETK